VDLCIHSPICLHGVVLNWLNTGTLPYPLDRRLVGLRAGLDVVEKKEITYSCRESNPGRPVRRPVAVPSELSRLMSCHVRDITQRVTLHLPVAQHVCQGYTIHTKTDPTSHSRSRFTSTFPKLIQWPVTKCGLED
jgi:hypothetical protein